MNGTSHPLPHDSCLPFTDELVPLCAVTALARRYQVTDRVFASPGDRHDVIHRQLSILVTVGTSVAPVTKDRLPLLRRDRTQALLGDFFQTTALCPVASLLSWVCCPPHVLQITTSSSIRPL